MELVPLYQNDQRVSDQRVRSSSAVLREGDRAANKVDDVYYDNAFGPNTQGRYRALFEGFKEEIVLTRRPASNRLETLLLTHGAPARLEDDGRVVIGKSFEILPIELIDSSTDYTRWEANNKYELEVLVPNEEYRLVYVLNEAFLDSDDVTYPVIVDPVAQIINVTVGGTRHIKDVTGYTGGPNWQMGGAGYIITGYVSEQTKVGETLISFPGLRTNTLFNQLPVTNMTVHLCNRNLQPDSAFIESFYSNQATPWNDLTLTYAQFSKGGHLAYHDFYGKTNPNTYMSFNITGIVSAWKNSHAMLERGIFFVNTTSANHAVHGNLQAALQSSRTFYSTKTSGSFPYLSFTYITRPAVTNPLPFLRINTSMQITTSPSLALNWTSSNMTIATVTSEGRVTAKGKYGKVTMTATYSDGSVMCSYDVYVYDKVLRVNVTYDNHYGSRGGSEAKIKTAMNKVAMLYISQFGIYTHAMSVTPATGDLARPNACTSPIGGKCTHGACTGSDPTHHKNSDFLFTKVLVPPPNELNFHITGAQLCWGDAPHNSWSGTGSTFDAPYPRRAMAQAAQTGTHLTYIMAHEIGHSYVNAADNLDHYGSISTERNNCIYGYGRNNMRDIDEPSSLRVCSRCKELIAKKQDAYNYR